MPIHSFIVIQHFFSHDGRYSFWKYWPQFKSPYLNFIRSVYILFCFCSEILAYRISIIHLCNIVIFFFRKKIFPLQFMLDSKILFLHFYWNAYKNRNNEKNSVINLLSNVQRRSSMYMLQPWPLYTGYTLMIFPT